LRRAIIISLVLLVSLITISCGSSVTVNDEDASALARYYERYKDADGFEEQQEILWELWNNCELGPVVVEFDGEKEYIRYGAVLKENITGLDVAEVRSLLDGK
jgi:hypothetical protein